MAVDRNALCEAAQSILNANGLHVVYWAAGYAAQLRLMLDDPETTDHDLRIQCKYVLANIPYWRGEIAARTRKILKEFVAQKDIPS